MKNVILTLVAFLLCSTCFATDASLDKAPKEIVIKIFQQLPWKNLCCVGQTCQQLYEFWNEYNKMEDQPIAELMTANKMVRKFCSYREGFCIFEGSTSKKNVSTTVNLYNGNDLTKRTLELGSISINGIFASHEKGACCVDSEQITLIDLSNLEKNVCVTLNSFETSIGKYCRSLTCVAENNIVLNDGHDITVFNLSSKEHKSCGIYHIKSVSGLNDYVFIFRDQDGFRLVNCPDFAVHQCANLGYGSFVACACQSGLMVTCHKEVVQSFVRTAMGQGLDPADSHIYVHRRRYLNAACTSLAYSKEMEFALPLSMPVSQIFLKDNLLVIASLGDKDWLLITYDMDEKCILRVKKGKNPPSKLHVANKYIFAIYKNKDAEKVVAISLTE